MAHDIQEDIQSLAISASFLSRAVAGRQGRFDPSVCVGPDQLISCCVWFPVNQTFMSDIAQQFSQPFNLVMGGAGHRLYRRVNVVIRNQIPMIFGLAINAEAAAPTLSLDFESTRKRYVMAVHVLIVINHRRFLSGC
jgi:hypothetical protein